MRTIFIIGMPGAGKSHWGQLWGKAYGFELVDLDKNVEAHAELSIPEIFAGVGETGFRTLEAAVLLNTILAARPRNTIIVTGGGTPVLDGNMDMMLRAGYVVYLECQIEKILSNILASSSVRPLLQDCNLDKLNGMFTKRKPFYERAHLIVDAEKVTIDTFGEILRKCTSLQS